MTAWDAPYVVASAPGRLELAGNHTDHQGGRVISAALDRMIRAQARPNGSPLIRARMAGFPSVELDTAAPDFCAPHADEAGTSAALIRGMAAAYRAAGGMVAGFDLEVSGDLPAGAGVSSSAAFETCVGAVLRALGTGAEWNPAAPAVPAHPAVPAAPVAGVTPEVDVPEGGTPEGDAARLALALDGVTAERDYFGKSCGAQDQIASAFGGIVHMDFSPKAPALPQVTRLSADLAAAGYTPVLIDTGVDHSRFNADFDRVPADMFAVAQALGATRLADVPASRFAVHADRISRTVGPLAADRARHYYAETARVGKQADALSRGDVAAFLRLAIASGDSSANLLRNVTPSSVGPDDTLAQRPAAILARCERLLTGHSGAWRIHGGGFGGSVLAIVPADAAAAFIAEMDGWLGAGTCMIARIAPAGAAACWIRDPLPSSRLYWTGETRYGTIEMSVNLAKPEKDPRAIAAAVERPPVGSSFDARALPCDLCCECAGFDAAAERSRDPRIGSPQIGLPSDDDMPETWRLHFSPYGYYPLHCIVMSDVHRPMAITRGCLRRLIACVERWPFYFFGSNADLPIVGGSILAHDHFQGGGHVFPLMRAPLARRVLLPGARPSRPGSPAISQGSLVAAEIAAERSACPASGEYPAVTCGIVRWPASTLRLSVAWDPAWAPSRRAAAAESLVAAAWSIIGAWERFDCPECGIIAQSHGGADGSTDARHSTVTPIVYLQSFARTVPPQQPGNAAGHSAGSTADAAGHSAGSTDSDALVLDLVLRNNRTTPERPYGLFHSDESLHHIKKENIGLIEIMGLSILPGRLAAEIPGLAQRPPDGLRGNADETVRSAPQSFGTLAQDRRNVTEAFAQILESTGVFKDSPQGRAGWEAFARSFHGTIE